MDQFIDLNLTFANGDFQRLVAKALNQDTNFADVSLDFVPDFANTAWMEIRVRGILIGAYNLAGTNQMINELVRCARIVGGQAS